MTVCSQNPPSIRVLGTRVHMVENPQVVALMDAWIESDRQRFHHVINTGMHGIMEARADPNYRSILNRAEVLAPDGFLVIRLARLRGFRLNRKETGPELMWRFLQRVSGKRYKHYFYGDTEETLQILSAKLNEAFPGIRIVGLHSPPFRTLTPEEDEADIAAINQAEPDILWVGLGTPKQENWIAEHREGLNVPVAVGVGAAFKFVTGKVQRAPAMVRNLGLEWLWRLLLEPKRIWRRVFVDAPQFIVLATLELIGLKRYS